MKRNKLRKRKTSKKGNKHKKKYIRSRRIRLQKGGLRYDVMGITNTWSFKNPEHLTAFQEYIFGTPEHLYRWITIFEACKEKDISIFIVTSGNLTGVIRTIQLLGLAKYVEEVIAIHEDRPDRNPNPMIDPDRYFAGETKAHVIQRIMKDKGISCEREGNELPLAAFFDDQPHNFEGLGLCPSVKIVNVGGTFFNMNEKSIRAKELVKRIKANFFYMLFKDRHDRQKLSDQNFTPDYYLDLAFSGITGDRTIRKYDRFDEKHLNEYSNIKILFLDWDGTVSFWPGPPEFNDVDFRKIKDYINIDHI
jgi:hypothetical protein